MLTGRKVAEIPDQMRYWDHERNTIDPSQVAAGSNKPRFWVCHGHEDGDPLGRWPGHPHRWEQPPQQRFFVGQGCKFCMQREACPATCLATTHPHLVPEWDHAANAEAGNGLTPENVTPGSDREAFWICPTHGPYKRKVNERTGLGFGCPVEEQEKGQRERREKVNAMRRKDRARALDAIRDRRSPR